ncbi:hypothetical protein [Brevundimonas sp.]|uniref:hypothetical protein n=1 Tax=Brevundimonas sp. TaxID=1871086 RepID=UPI00289FA7B2|nr:hypothetical protein [Brevundimonas sp.]
MLKPTEIALLFKFYQRAQIYSGGGIYGDSLLEHIEFTDDVRAALLLGRLKKEGFVGHRGHGSANRSVYAVTDKGEAYIESLIETDDAALDAALNLIGSPSQSSPPQAPEQGEIADEEPSWSPLPIDLGTDDTKALIEEAEKTVTELLGDNGYAVSHPVERAEVVSRLQAGVGLIKNAPAITYSAIQVYFVWPLQKLANRFPMETAKGVLIKILWDGLTDWIKKRGGDLLDGIFK